MKRIILTERDQNIIDFLTSYKCATTSTLNIIFFNSLRSCQKRLKLLIEYGFISSTREYVSDELIHYIKKKPSQLQHSQLATKLISLFYVNNYKILKCKTEFKCGDLRSDLLIVYEINNQTKISFVEICNTKKFDLNKYISLYDSKIWKEYFPIFPSIIVVSNKPIENYPKFKIFKHNLKLEELKIE